jgi:hypothetical protein
MLHGILQPPLQPFPPKAAKDAIGGMSRAHDAV